MEDAGKTRKFLRIKSTKEEPITVTFKQPELKKLESKVAVRDISLEGLGLKIPLGSRAFKEGMTIEDMEVRLPGAVKCTLSGKIVYKRLGHCGIEFLDGNPLERRKLQALNLLKGKDREKV